MTPQEILEEMIDYIINHKDNLNGNILMEMLEYFDNDDGETPAPNPNPGGGINI